jgi:hypothetical protein
LVSYPESTHKKLFSMFPPGKSRVIPWSQPYGLPGWVQVQFKDQHMGSQALKG